MNKTAIDLRQETIDRIAAVVVEKLKNKEDDVDEFERLRSDVLNRRNWQDSCRFVLQATEDKYSWFHVYRAHPEKYKLEKDVEDGLWAIDRDDNLLRWYHLRHIRRFFLRRYAFWSACRVNKRLKASKEVGWLWLYKDILLLRAALALVLGYGVVLGAGDTVEALRVLAGKPRWNWIWQGRTVH